MVFIYVSGMHGSGKTYLRDRLNGVNGIKAYDLDEIYDQAYELVKNTATYKAEVKKYKEYGTPRLVNMTHTLMNKLRVQNKGKITVICGLMIKQKKSDIGYHIKVDDLEQTYRNLLIRMHTDIARDIDKIVSTIRNTKDVTMLGDRICYMERFAMCCESFSDYVADYKKYLIRAEKYGHKVMCQGDIIKEILSICHKK